MEQSVRIWSKAFLLNASDEDPHDFTIQVDQGLWQRVLEANPNAKRFFIRIVSTLEDQEWIAPMGQPVPATDAQSQNSLYIPLWMLDSSGFLGMGDTHTVTFLDQDSFPPATRITLRIVDSVFYDTDVKEELEMALTKMGVIRQGTQLQIPLARLDGFLVDLYVAKTEPANIVLCDGDEVAVEFEEPVDTVPVPPPRPPTPIPEEPSRLDSLMVPLPIPSAIPSSFPGQGRLVGPGGEPPAWRRGLPPPRNPHAPKPV